MEGRVEVRKGQLVRVGVLGVTGLGGGAIVWRRTTTTRGC